MTSNFKNIHVGRMIKVRVDELNIDILRIVKFFDMQEDQITEMYQNADLGTGLLLRWCKLLDYDFFRVYSQHLILFSPPSNAQVQKATSTRLPTFRKNIYTKEIIEFILELIRTNEKTTKQIMDEYRIPKVTIYNWIKKYTNSTTKET